MFHSGIILQKEFLLGLVGIITMMIDERDEHQEEDTTRLISEEELAGIRQPRSETREACLVVVSGGEIGREYGVDREEIVIGRCDSADIRINSRLVSRRHAAIRSVRDHERVHYIIQDLDSMNGTLVNNVAITSANLRDGDKIQIGEVVFKFGFRDAVDEQFHKQIHKLIHYDRLTGLMTMESFRRVLEDTIQCSRPDEHFSLSMNDLDGLKRVNDTFGHLAGRMVVESMGRIIRETLRENDVPALYGGDETVILYSRTCLADAVVIAEKLRVAIESMRFEYGGNNFGVTISQGLAEWPRHGSSAEKLIAAADAALYRAKAAGRNCVMTADA